MELEWLLTTLVIFSIAIISLAGFTGSFMNAYSLSTTGYKNYTYLNRTKQITSKMKIMQRTLHNATEPSYLPDWLVYNPLSVAINSVVGALQLIIDTPNLVHNIIVDFGSVIGVSDFITGGIITVVLILVIFAFIRSFLKARV